MIELNNIARIYFIGIGGIGMSALAKYFNEKGIIVSGYDKTATSVTKQMESEGINIHYEDTIELLDKKAQLVVYTPAVPHDHRQLTFYMQNNYPVVKRSDVLQQITNDSFNICIAGTHGKTTISTMVAHILRDSGSGCTAFLGGTAVNYNTNFWSSDNNVCVVEADEYDRSFLKLKPDLAVISAMDPDHLDIYGTEEIMQQAFISFSENIKPNGLLISKFGLNKAVSLKAANHINYSLQNDSADVYADNIKMMHGGYQFDVLTKNWMIDNVVLQMGGMHNVENAVAAITVAHHLKIDSNKIREAIKNFKGIKRRFEYIFSPQFSSSSATHNKPKSDILIDDYAHHPEELKALINGAKSLFTEMKCTVVFQPHLYTRTRDLAEEFARSLDLADEVILLPIYPARELPIESVSSEMILSKMKNKNSSVRTKEELLNYFKSLKKSTNDDNEASNLFITAGAGDIDTMVEPIKNILMQKTTANNYA
ncbi:MAG: UDP-N-acetylmuramate--L-alanine ligase [Ginsengibacter sp.]